METESTIVDLIDSTTTESKEDSLTHYLNFLSLMDLVDHDECKRGSCPILDFFIHKMKLLNNKRHCLRIILKFYDESYLFSFVVGANY